MSCRVLFLKGARLGQLCIPVETRYAGSCVCKQERWLRSGEPRRSASDEGKGQQWGKKKKQHTGSQATEPGPEPDLGTGSNSLQQVTSGGPQCSPLSPLLHTVGQTLHSVPSSHDSGLSTAAQVQALCPVQTTAMKIPSLDEKGLKAQQCSCRGARSGWAFVLLSVKWAQDSQVCFHPRSRFVGQQVKLARGFRIVGTFENKKRTARFPEATATLPARALDVACLGLE